MLRSRLFAVVSVLTILLPACSAVSQSSAVGQHSVMPLIGRIGSSPAWGSGWLDLTDSINLKRGEKLRLTLGGSAKKVIVRLLTKGDNPDSAAGAIRPVKTVPEDGIIEVVLPSDFLHVVQISVHGGPNPWNQFSLGNGNGPATLIRVERVRAGN